MRRTLSEHTFAHRAAELDRIIRSNLAKKFGKGRWMPMSGLLRPLWFEPVRHCYRLVTTEITGNLCFLETPGSANCLVLPRDGSG